MKTAEDILNEKPRDLIWISGDKSILDAVRLMVDNDIGAILIKQEDRFTGIFSERDLLRHTADPAFDPGKHRVGDYMSSPLHCAPHDMPLILLTEKFLGLFVRHLMIEKQGRQIGLLSIGDVLRANLLEQDHQIKELNAIASWEYYEDWGWGRKKRTRGHHFSNGG
jgi:CBS domain-containing protein